MSGRRLVVLLSALSGALLLAAPALAGGRPGKGPDAQPPTDQLVVRLAPGSTLDASALAATAGVDLKKLRQLPDGSFVLKLGKRHSLADADAISARLASRADVASAEPDEMMVPFATTPNDTRWAEQWDMLAPSSGFYGINLLAAWDLAHESADDPGRRHRHGVPPARRHREPDHPGLRLHRRRAGRKRRQRP